jgi:hypothetical protein
VENASTPIGIKLTHLLWGAGGALAGAWWIKDQDNEAKKSQAERDDPDGVAEICAEVGPILDDWEPEEFECEDDYVNDLFEYLAAETDVDPDSCVEDLYLRPDTREGIPDVLIDDHLAIEVKRNLNKSERDRLIGQCAGYSREWVTWIVLIDTLEHRVRELEELLDAKGLGHILVFSFA